MNKYKKIKPFLIYCVPFIIFFLSAIYITYPLLFHLGDYVTALGDELVIAWIQNWVIHALTTNPPGLFEANLYFPYHNTLAFSETFIVTSILALPLRMFTGEPIITVNFTLISSLVLLGFSIYLLSYYLTRDFFTSLLAGILVIFSPAVLDKATHLQILSIYWVPLSILFFIKFIKSQRAKDLIISLLFFLLQTYNSFMPGYFILFSFFIIFIFTWLNNKKQTKKLVTKRNLFILTFSFLLLIPIVIPYYKVSKEFNYTRDIRDSIHLALQPEDLLYSSPLTRIQKKLLSLPFNQQSQNNEFKPGYVGFIFTILIIISIYYFIKNHKKPNKQLQNFITIAFTGLILSFGPALHLGRQTIHDPFPIPLPYALFYYILPGFQGFRNSARWEMLFILAISIAIAIMLQEFFEKKSIITKSIIYTLLIIATIIEFNFPMHFERVTQRKDFPQVYSWLATTPKDTAVIIMPIYNWSSTYAGEEMKREYFSTINFRQTVNGYSGFSPPPWQKLLTTLHQDFPGDNSINILKDLGVNYIIVDKYLYDRGYTAGNEKVNGESVINALKKNSSIKFVNKLGDHYIFKYIL